MSPEAVLNLVLGQGGALVLLCVAVVFLYRRLAAVEAENKELWKEKVQDAEDGAKLGEAYLKTHRGEK